MNWTMDVHDGKGPGAMTILTPGAVARWRAIMIEEIGVSDGLENVLSTITTNPDTRTTPRAFATKTIKDRHPNPIANLQRDVRDDTCNAHVRDYAAATS